MAKQNEQNLKSFFGLTVDLETLAAEQGASVVSDFDALLGNFWLDDETADNFIAAVREWRHGDQGARRLWL
jgi:hypothetical protein